LANLKPDNIFKGIQDGTIQAQAGLNELETRLLVVQRTLEATPGLALMIGGLGDRYRGEIAALEDLIPKIKELRESQRAAAEEQADNLAMRKIEADSMKMLLEPYQEAITTGKDYVKQNIDNRTSAEKLRDELEKAYATLYQLKEAQGVAGNSTEQFSSLIQGAEDKVRQLELQLQRLQTALNLEVYAIKAVTEGFERSLDLSLKRAELETRILGMSREEAEVARATGTFRQQLLGQTAALEDRINKIREVGTEEEKKLLPVLEAQRDRYAEIERRQLPLIEAQAKLHSQAMDQVDAQKKAEQEAIRERDKLERESESERKKAARELQKLQEEFLKRRLDAEKQISTFQFDAGERLRDQYADLELEGLFGVQKTLKEIELQERRTADAARQRLKEQFGEKDPEGLAAAIAQIDSAAEESLRKRQEAARAIAQEQRSFASGWNRAWGQYADDASNASKQAERLFTKSTQGMEDAIVGFAKTGKFEWKSFVNVILEELLRSNLRQLIAAVFAPANSSGGTAGAQRLIAGAPGVAQTNSAQGTLTGLGGGPQAQNSGGGLLGAIGSLFSGSSSSNTAQAFPVAPGGGSIMPDDFTDFGGFFANGGTIPSGKFGIVGERGPEFISGPANITPMGGMGTTVNYTVNAVDARSFQELLATDPRTLFAITEQGRKSLPGYRR
jgi:lambda family phage tail tape measure protein